jgi:hypothetical protein
MTVKVVAFVVSAGIDTALQLAATLTNDEVARMVQLAIEVSAPTPGTVQPAVGPQRLG